MRALAVLAPWLGEDRVSVQVTALLEDSETRQTVERVRNVVVAGQARPLEKTVRTTRVPEGRIQRIHAILVLGFDASTSEISRARQMAHQALGSGGTGRYRLSVYALPVAAPRPQAGMPSEAPQVQAPGRIPQVEPVNPPSHKAGSFEFQPWMLAAVVAILFLQVPFRAHLSLYADETSALCHWHLPEAHYLEGWSDTRAYDGTVSIQQPLIAPLYGGRTSHELVSAVLGEPRARYDTVRDYWKGRLRTSDFDAIWRKALHDGVFADSALPAKRPALQGTIPAPPAAQPGWEIIFRPDQAVWDGRFANNAWLQELPKPLTKLTWDNAALIGPADAEKLGVKNEDVVELAYASHRLKVPVWISPGHADGAVTLHLGYGRTRAGRAGTGIGVNACALRPNGQYDHGLCNKWYLGNHWFPGHWLCCQRLHRQ